MKTESKISSQCTTITNELIGAENFGFNTEYPKNTKNVVL